MRISRAHAPLLLICFLSAKLTHAEKTVPVPDGKLFDNAKLSRAIYLEKRLLELESKVQLMKEELDEAIPKANRVGSLSELYDNAFFVDASSGFLKPKADQFTNRVDLGLGAAFALGRFFGPNNSFSLGLDYDVHAAATLRYRFRWHWDKPYLSFGPTFAIRHKMLNLPPWDNYISKDELIPSIYTMVGLGVEFPMVRNAIYIDFSYMMSNRPFLSLRIGFLVMGD